MTTESVGQRVSLCDAAFERYAEFSLFQTWSTESKGATYPIAGGCWACDYVACGAADLLRRYSRPPCTNWANQKAIPLSSSWSLLIWKSCMA